LIAKLTEENPEFSTLYRDYHSGAEYGDNPTDLWTKPCDIALPCATQNELPLESAKALVKNGCYLVCEGANMPSTLEAIHYLQHKDILFAPGKAANAGGVAVSGFEMSQNAMHQSWSYKDVDEMLKKTMKDIFKKSYAEAEKWADPRNLVVGANVAGFMRVYDAMVAQGVI
jgi:glutamate dehydrogenase (NADP+)